MCVSSCMSSADDAHAQHAHDSTLWQCLESCVPNLGLCARQIVDALLKAGMSCNARNGSSGFSVLSSAAAGMNHACIDALIDAAGGSLDVNIRDGPVRGTPLTNAAYVSSMEVVEALLRAGADPTVCNRVLGSNVMHSACDNPKCTPAMLALLSRGHPELIDQRRKPHVLKGYVACIVLETYSRLCQQPSDFVLGLAHTRGGTPLHEAAIRGRGDLVCWLLANGANPNARNARRCTPRDLALLFGPHTEVAAQLERAQASRRGSVPTRRGRIVLFWPCWPRIRSTSTVAVGPLGASVSDRSSPTRDSFG